MLFPPSCQINHRPDACLTQCNSADTGPREWGTGPLISQVLMLHWCSDCLFSLLPIPSPLALFQNPPFPIKTNMYAFKLQLQFKSYLLVYIHWYPLSLNSIIIMVMSIKCTEWVTSYLISVKSASETSCWGQNVFLLSLKVPSTITTDIQ